MEKSKSTAAKSSKGRKKEPASEIRNTGIAITPPRSVCEDKNCPFHGNLGLRGRTFTARVVRARVPKNALVEWSWSRHVPKYERYEKRRTRLMVHSPACIGAKEGDLVRIMETRKISKTKSFVIVEKIENAGN